MLGGWDNKGKSEKKCGESPAAAQGRVGWTIMVPMQMEEVDGFEIYFGKETTELING